MRCISSSGAFGGGAGGEAEYDSRTLHENSIRAGHAQIRAFPASSIGGFIRSTESDHRWGKAHFERHGPMTQPDLRSGIRRGIVWSSMNAIILRAGTFAVGIFLARILAPEQFGVFAIALTVQAVLMTLADFGLSTDLIRSPDHEEKAPTVATMGLMTGAGLFLMMMLTSQQTADLLGSPRAGPVIAVMSGSLLLAGLGVVPYAKLQREFQQKRLFHISLVEFVVVNTLIVSLVMAGWGVMALAVARIVAQLCTLILQFVLAGVRPKFGFDRTLAPGVIAFGLPVAGANMLSWMLLNVDNIVISRLTGAVALGFYYLAFNISNWPMSAIGQVVRSIALPAFARDETRNPKIFAHALALTWPVTLFAGFMLSILSGPVIEVVYGPTWLVAAPMLAALGFFGALRAVFDLAASFLLARGHSSLTLIIQAVWLITLIPLMVWGTSTHDALGAAVAHLLCAILIVTPLYLWALSKSGTPPLEVLGAMWPPLLAIIPALVAILILRSFDLPALADLLVSGFVGAALYGVCLYRWYSRKLRVGVPTGAGAEKSHIAAAPTVVQEGRGD